MSRTQPGPQPGPHPALPLTASRPALLQDGSDRAFRELVHDMLAFSATIQDVRNRLGSFIGLSGTQYTVLMSIARLSGETGELGVNQLAENLHLSGAFVTIEVNKLVGLGLVTKTINPDDRRRVVLTITGEARRRLEVLNHIQRPANDALFAPLSAQDFVTLRAIMGRLAGTGPGTFAVIEEQAREVFGIGAAPAGEDVDHA